MVCTAEWQQESHTLQPQSLHMRKHSSVCSQVFSKYKNSVAVAVAVAVAAVAAVAVAHLQLEHEDSLEDVGDVSKGDASLFGVQVLGEKLQTQLEDACPAKGSLL